MRHVLEQGAMLRALGGAALSGLRAPRGGEAVQCPGPWIEHEVAAPSPSLVAAYVRHVGGEPGSYRATVPAHLFPQWGLPLASRVLARTSYPLVRVVNAGVRLQIRAPLPSGERFLVKARLEAVDDDGQRAILTQRIVTGTRAEPDAVIADVRARVPLRSARPAKDKRGGAAATVPPDAREIAYFRLGPGAGFDFAKLTGDFNPIHWVPAAARATGFRAVILHGFSTLARAMEATIVRVLSGNAAALREVDVRFTRPLTLPAKVGVYVDPGGGLFVGDAPGDNAYLAGRFEARFDVEGDRQP
jgi:hypothetical protein